MSNLGVKPIFNYGKRAAAWVFDKLPSVEFKSEKILKGIKSAGLYISSPQNRVILGATALMSQPFIDLHNKHVDDETRKVSMARTVAKIVAGTSTGFLVRHYSIKAVDAFTKNPDKAENFLHSILFPKGISKVTAKGMIQYRKALGTFISLAVMMFTNFAIDAPLTKILTNIFVKKIKDYDRNITDKQIMNQLSQVQNTQNPQLKNETMFCPRTKMDEFVNRKEAE